ncbi:MAG: hypothetical protein EBV32_03760, partial [Proteobacteria bacterium]|nr:hypothetical protein [Candidatus Fonsibacter lacus]NBP60107.1 hypothetical protein [Pseudomonadota bacterium]NCU72244.1 hypothetical protein [Candidatus Fonsibacter lacus]
MAETRTINLEIKDNVKSLKTQYREAVQEVQRLADTYGNTSKEAAEAAKRAAELKDRIEESKSLTDAFNPDAKFNALSGSIGGVLNGFQAYEGAMGLIGVESEALQETLLKVQSAMALSQGIQGALEAKDAFVNLTSVVKNSFSAMTTAGKLFAVTGIGALVTGVAYLMGAFDDATESISKYASAQKTSNDIQQKAIEDSAEELSALNKLQTQINDETLTREQKNLAVKKLQDAYPDLLKNVNAEKLSIGELNKAVVLNIKLAEARARINAAESLRASKYQEILTEEIKLQKERQDIEKERQLLEQDPLKNEQRLIFLEQQAKKTQERINASKEEIKQIDGITKADEALIAKVEEQTKVYETETPKVIKQVKERADYTVQLEKEQIDAMEDGMQKRIALLEFQQKDEISKIDKNGKKAGELRKAIEDRYAKEIEKVRYEFRDRSDRDDQINLEKKVATRISTGELELSAEEAIRTQIYQMNLEQDEKDKARIKQLNEYRVQAVKDGLQTISNLAELFAGKSEKQQKRAFQVQKAVNIANAVIDTYKAANTALASSPPPFNYIAMAAAITAGLVNVKKIASQQFQSSSSSSGGGGTPSAPEVAQAAPQFNTIGSSGINQLAQLQQQPVQAYVVSGEVTSAQA